MVLKVDDNTKIQFSKSAISSVVDKSSAAAKDSGKSSEDAEESGETESK